MVLNRDLTVFNPHRQMKQSTLPEAATPPTTSGNTEEMIMEPTDTDVLLGRGVSTNRHPGNINFRSVVSQHVVREPS
jgi:hypothetical protein